MTTTRSEIDLVPHWLYRHILSYGAHTKDDLLEELTEDAADLANNGYDGASWAAEIEKFIERHSIR